MNMNNILEVTAITAVDMDNKAKEQTSKMYFSK